MANRDFESFFRQQYNRNKKIGWKQVATRYRQEGKTISSKEAAEIARRVKGNAYNPKLATRSKSAPKVQSSNLPKVNKKSSITFDEFFRRNPDAKNWNVKKLQNEFRKAGGVASNDRINKAKRDYYSLPFQQKKSTRGKIIHKPFSKNDKRKYIISKRYVYVVSYYARKDDNEKMIEKRVFTFGSDRMLSRSEVIDGLFMAFNDFENIGGAKYDAWHIAEDKPIRIIGAYERE